MHAHFRIACRSITAVLVGLLLGVSGSRAESPSNAAQKLAQTSAPIKPSGAAATAGKTPRSVAFVDDPSRFSFVYAIRKGIVTSNTIQLDLHFTPPPPAPSAFQTKQYDLAEAPPSAVPGAAAYGFKMLITSTELEAKGASPLIVPADSPIKDPKDLKGKTIAIPSLTWAIMIPLRYVLQFQYGLNTDPQGGDVRWLEIAPDVAVGAVKAHKVDAALLVNQAAFAILNDRSFRTLFDPATAYNEMTKTQYVGSLLITYPDVAEKKHDAIVEFNRMLRDSIDYTRKHSDEVLADVAKERHASLAFLKYYYQQYSVPIGELSAQHKKNIQHLWEAVNKLGMLRQVPNIDDLSFK